MAVLNLVTDFGGDPTGVRDSIPNLRACAAAQNDGDLVIVPHGTYKMASGYGATLTGAGKRWLGEGLPHFMFEGDGAFYFNDHTTDFSFRNIEISGCAVGVFNAGGDFNSLDGFDFDNIYMHDCEAGAFKFMDAKCSNGRITRLKVRRMNVATAGFYGIVMGENAGGLDVRNSNLVLDDIDMEDIGGHGGSSYGLLLDMSEVNATNIRIVNLTGDINSNGTFDESEGIYLRGKGINITNFHLCDAGTMAQIQCKGRSNIDGRYNISNGYIGNQNTLTMDNTVVFNQGQVHLHNVWFDQVVVNSEVPEWAHCVVRTTDRNDAVEVSDCGFLMPMLQDKHGTQTEMPNWYREPKIDHGNNSLFRRLGEG